MNEEQWKPVVGYEGLYMVSDLGRIKSLNYSHTGEEKIMKTCNGRRNYQLITLTKDGIEKMYRVHRLVAMAFLPNPDNLPCVNHKDENPLNNSVENLEWCTHKYNSNYGTGIERQVKKRINGKKAKKILQYSLDGQFIREWPSLREIERQLGFANTHISECCRGKYKQSYGYIWRFKEPQAS